jgi:hypothetical protein
VLGENEENFSFAVYLTILRSAANVSHHIVLLGKGKEGKVFPSTGLGGP